MISQDPVVIAKAVIASHERYAAAGDLDGIMSNGTEDIVMMVPGVPLIQGIEAGRDFYRGMLAQGRWEFVHDYDGAIATGDAVILHGVARITFTPTGGQPVKLANNFLLVLRKQSEGTYRFSRVAFAPSA